MMKLYNIIKAKFRNWSKGKHVPFPNGHGLCGGGHIDRPFVARMIEWFADIWRKYPTQIILIAVTLFGIIITWCSDDRTNSHQNNKGQEPIIEKYIERPRPDDTPPTLPKKGKVTPVDIRKI
jgi:hypothetical protein